MNIFVLDEDPVKAAEYHCNKHVCKMIIESAQMLCTTHWLYLEKEIKKTIPGYSKKHLRRSGKTFNFEFKSEKVKDRISFVLKHADPNRIPPYRMTHVKHQCTIWASTNYSNYVWLLQLSRALCNEYTKRYKKVHKTEAVIEWLENNIPAGIPIEARTPFSVAIKNKDIKIIDKSTMMLCDNKNLPARTKEIVLAMGTKSGCVVNETGEYVSNFPSLAIANMPESKYREYFAYYDVVASYRNYYIKEKSRFAIWEPKASTPKWYKESLNERL